MGKSQYELAVYRYCKANRKPPTALTDDELHQLALESKTFSQKYLQDGPRALVSRSMTELGLRNVPLPVFEERRNRCMSQKCGRSMVSANGNVVCMVCGCSGQWMIGAMRDTEEECRLPSDKKLWRKYRGPTDTGL